MDYKLARIVMEECTGTYSGHMAAIPNNPTLWSIFNILTADAPKHQTREKDFADCLREIADAIDPPQQKDNENE